MDIVVRQPWAEDFKTAPAKAATLPDGSSHVSYRCGDRELSIYGDLDSPSGIEVGVHCELLFSDAAKRECVGLLAAFLDDRHDEEVLRSLDLAQDSKERGDLKFQVRPVSDAGANGAWRVSVFDKTRTARAPRQDTCRSTPPPAPAAACPTRTSSPEPSNPNAGCRTATDWSRYAPRTRTSGWDTGRTTRRASRGFTFGLKSIVSRPYLARATAGAWRTSCGSYRAPGQPTRAQIRGANPGGSASSSAGSAQSG